MLPSILSLSKKASQQGEIGRERGNSSDVERFNAMIKKNTFIPEKIKDPGSCTIPYGSGAENLDKVLCDLKLGVSLMAQTMAYSIGILGKIKPT